MKLRHPPSATTTPHRGAEHQNTHCLLTMLQSIQRRSAGGTRHRVSSRTKAEAPSKNPLGNVLVSVLRPRSDSSNSEAEQKRRTPRQTEQSLPLQSPQSRVRRNGPT